MRRRVAFRVAVLAITAVGAPFPGRIGGQGAPPRAPGVSIIGVVRDSVAHRPLAGAIVQLAPAGALGTGVRAATADSLGRFAFTDVAAGRWVLGFLHPLLDSLGIEPPLHEIDVEGRRDVHVTLATPSAGSLRAAVCGAGPASGAGAVVGQVRDPRTGDAVGGAAVTAEWLEFSLGTGGVTRRLRRTTSLSKDNGWFALCDVPSAGSIVLAAMAGGDSTDRIDLDMPVEGLLRHTLYVASPKSGSGQLRGTVVTAVGARPLAGAQVSVGGTAQSRANERGEWSLGDAPLGTRMLEVRAVGYYPMRRPVDVIAGAAPIDVTLGTLRSVLDTITVSARRTADKSFEGLDRRRTSGMGHFITADELARRNLRNVSDAFRTLPGVRVDRDAFGGTTVVVRGATADWCTPAFFVNGSYMRMLSVADIDDWLQPTTIAAIEVYTGSAVPPQFQAPLSGCGSIVIWTK